MEHMIQEWKEDIRDMLQRVHSQFIEMINEFTRKFYKSLVKIELSERMKPYVGEDRR